MSTEHPQHPQHPPHPQRPEPSQRPDAYPAAPAAGPGPVEVRDRRPTPWLALVSTATAAALVASVATAGLTGAFAPEQSPSQATTTATLEQQESQTVPVAGSAAGQPDWQAVAAAVRESVVAIDVRTGSGSGEGSGVVVDAEGHVLTNDHVVGDAVDDGLRVTLADGRVFEATLVGADPTTDLAVVALVDPPTDLVPAVLGDSDALEVGAGVMAVGNPLGLDSTVTTGIVSALDRPVTTASDSADEPVVTNAIQIDAAINPGNSGGPLFDASGEVVGITSSIASLSSGGSGSSTGSIGLGFAIPVNLADRVAAELLEDGTASHAFLGVTLGDGTATSDGTTRLGAVVGEVTPGSPADEAGLAPEDVVVAIDGDAVSGAESLTAYVREHTAGEQVSLTVVRQGETRDLTAVLAARDEVTAENSGSQEGGRSGSGSEGVVPGDPWDPFDRG
ncbi:S1C family serine protease [Actinotalea soli]|nr:trypsin-like peptidase domain-containing protein [Actinotalea soli]